MSFYGPFVLISGNQSATTIDRDGLAVEVTRFLAGKKSENRHAVLIDFPMGRKELEASRLADLRASLFGQGSLGIPFLAAGEAILMLLPYHRRFICGKPFCMKKKLWSGPLAYA
ncbi:MAG TPA: hypothetical protein VJT72_02075 [Pseudonocardiaceae bacterium]|nr:hypothetical protein [Pseudonocardiaceae bacterium]